MCETIVLDDLMGIDYKEQLKKEMQEANAKANKFLQDTGVIDEGGNLIDEPVKVEKVSRKGRRRIRHKQSKIKEVEFYYSIGMLEMARQKQKDYEDYWHEKKRNKMWAKYGNDFDYDEYLKQREEKKKSYKDIYNKRESTKLRCKYNYYIRAFTSVQDKLPLSLLEHIYKNLKGGHNNVIVEITEYDELE